MNNFPKGVHPQLADSFSLHQWCPIIGENTVVHALITSFLCFLVGRNAKKHFLNYPFEKPITPLLCFILKLVIWLVSIWKATLSWNGLIVFFANEGNFWTEKQTKFYQFIIVLKLKNTWKFLYKKWSFSLSISTVNETKADLVTFTEEILNGKLCNIFCAVKTLRLERFSTVARLRFLVLPYTGIRNEFFSGIF